MVEYRTWRPDEALFVYASWLCSVSLLLAPPLRTIALILIVAYPTMLLLWDARGVVTLRGVLEWRTMNGLTILVFAFVMTLLFPLTMLLYFLIACADWRVARHDAKRYALKRAFAQRVVTTLTANKSDTTKSA